MARIKTSGIMITLTKTVEVDREFTPEEIGYQIAVANEIDQAQVLSAMAEEMYSWNTHNTQRQVYDMCNCIYLTDKAKALILLLAEYVKNKQLNLQTNKNTKL